MFVKTFPHWQLPHLPIFFIQLAVRNAFSGRLALYCVFSTLGHSSRCVAVSFCCIASLINCCGLCPIRVIIKQSFGSEVVASHSHVLYISCFVTMSSSVGLNEIYPCTILREWKSRSYCLMILTSLLIGSLRKWAKSAFFSLSPLMSAFKLEIYFHYFCRWRHTCHRSLLLIFSSLKAFPLWIHDQIFATRLSEIFHSHFVSLLLL